MQPSREKALEGRHKVKMGRLYMRLLITCPDRSGIIAKVTGFLKDHHANITDLDQHSTDPQGGTLFMRVEFQSDDEEQLKKQIETTFDREVGQLFEMDWKVFYSSSRKRMAVLVSKHDHALLEILWRCSRHELPMELPFIISNHLDLKKAADHFEIPFYHIPVTSNTKQAAEEETLALCQGKVDGIILARYMQILSGAFIAHYPNNIINIHHSFLPAFMGADPYQQAYDHGVKLIGATAHYVTQELDRGPIISQDVVRVSHRLNVQALRELGRDIERRVLVQAVKNHLEDRIIVDGNKTIVFENI
jgi:formyltetrahydrofolate deformylase